jgi:hypothetical protein
VAAGPADVEAVKRVRPESGETGASLVEFALVLPLFFLVLLGMMTGGLAYSRKLSVAQAAREGARYGATLPISGSVPLTTWLTRVSDLTIASSDGELNSGKPGRVVCVAYVTAAGSATRQRTVGTAAPVIESQPCIADDGRSGEARVQVLASRTSELEALVYNRTLTLSSHAVARFENP